MDAITDLSQGEFARVHFQHCDFGDSRLTRRAMQSAQSILKHPGGTLPHKLSANELPGFYRVANNPKVAHQRMLQGHRRRVFEQMNGITGDAKAPRVLRTAMVSVGFSRVTLPVPRLRRGEHSDQPAETFVIHVREIPDDAADTKNPSTGKKMPGKKGPGKKGPGPLEWILLSNVPVLNAADAWERVDWYACRPVIEELHKAMKPDAVLNCCSSPAGPRWRSRWHCFGSSPPS